MCRCGSTRGGATTNAPGLEEPPAVAMGIGSTRRSLQGEREPESKADRIERGKKERGIREYDTVEGGIRIVGNGAEGPPRLPSPVEDGLCTRFQQNEAATQTLPVYCFSTVSEMTTFLNGDNKSEEQSLEDTSQDSDPGEATSSSDNTPKLEIEEDDDEQLVVAHLYPQPTALYSPT
ncbi:hypothetical protein GDO81_021235 [Engystomops pustulosus]|uniref:Uncharacterized protein n=1 Tax=Engystomops pustulosus TaxID=76066 RepID=A0AAV6ZCS3_ENGPU|nr:hypothetical protein GDO81_021235 [Engystomops pustulosus]